MRTQKLFLVLVVLAVMVGCVTTNQLSVGQALSALGDQFLQTTKLYDQALAAQAITPNEYHDFAVFAQWFQKGYHEAYTAWSTGGDPQAIRQQLQDLRDELEIYILVLQRRPS